MENENILYKIVSFVSRDELDFLDKISKDIYFSTGRKIPRSQVIREVIQLAKQVRSFGNDIIRELSKSPNAQEPNKEKDTVEKRREHHE